MTPTIEEVEATILDLGVTPRPAYLPLILTREQFQQLASIWYQRGLEEAAEIVEAKYYTHDKGLSVEAIRKPSKE